MANKVPKQQVSIRIDAHLIKKLEHIESAEKWTSKRALYEHALNAYVEGKTHEIDFVLIDNAMTKIMKKNFSDLDARFSRLLVRLLLESGQSKRLLARLLADAHGAQAVREYGQNARAKAVKELKQPDSALDEILQSMSAKIVEENANNNAINNQSEDA